ncbi:unnamed protein product [Gadus morhua 'NCC']
MEHVVGSQGRSLSARAPGSEVPQAPTLTLCLAAPLHSAAAGRWGEGRRSGRVMAAVGGPRHKSPHCPPALKGALVFRVPGRPDQVPRSPPGALKGG